MMKRRLNIWLILLAGVLLCSTAQAQTVKELEEQRKNTLKLLETTSKVLSETRKTQQASVNKLSILSKSIEERSRLIRNIDREIMALDSEMERLQRETKKLEKQLEELRREYARMVQEAHINRSVYARIMFVLSAKNFDQSLRRLRYLQEYATYRKLQVEQIEKTKQEIELRVKTIAAHKQTQVEIRDKQSSETKKLTEDQNKEKVVLDQLKSREKTLRADLQRHQRRANELNRKIETLIAEEIRRAEERKRAAERAASRKETEAKPGTTPKPSAESAAVEKMTKEEALISGNFASNAGRLPWPVEKGYISGRYGIQPHPVLKHVTTNNKGVYIQTPARSNARAVFDGQVTQRFSVPGSNNGVIIQHGQYRTVYANLTEIYVTVGQKVTAKQNIGRIYTDTESDNKTELFFQIWKDRTILNPESWITR
jgi:septal ring factor EnvC (AmiA/AmiB activator)